MYKGSCLCGAVTYELTSQPVKVTHCHCTMCQKQHGAAFATYASLPKTDLVYTSGTESLAAYNSTGSVLRKFCKVCGSNIEWGGSSDYPDWVSIAIASLDTEYKPETINDIYEATKVCWYP